MQEDELLAIERQFEKAKLGGSGPQALADWAVQNAPTLFAAVRAGMSLTPAFCFDRDPLGALRPLYPGTSEAGLHLDELAADDIRALRAERSRWANGANDDAAALTLPSVVVEPGDYFARFTNNGDEVFRIQADGEVVVAPGFDVSTSAVVFWDAVRKLRPPVGAVIADQADIAKAIDFVEALRPFAVLGSPPLLKRMEELAENVSIPDPNIFSAVTDDDEAILARITRADCERAHKLVAEADA